MTTDLSESKGLSRFGFPEKYLDTHCTELIYPKLTLLPLFPWECTNKYLHLYEYTIFKFPLN